MKIEGVDAFSLLGINDHHLQLIEDRFSADIIVRGENITLRGEPSEVQQIERIFKELTFLLTKNGTLTSNDVDTVLDLVAVDSPSQSQLRAELPKDLRWHDLRHTWASWHVMAGTPLEVLMRLGGWASLDMVLRYAHLAPSYLAGYADAVALNPTSSGGGTDQAGSDNFRTNSGTAESKDLAENDAKSLIEIGVADGVRTHDNWNHNPGLYR